MRNRSPHLLLVVLLVLVGIVPRWLLLAEDVPSETTDVQLLKRMEQLEARVKQLEDQLKRTPAQVIVTPRQPVPQLYTAPQSSVPPNAIPQEINGLRYYHLLLDNETVVPTPPVLPLRTDVRKKDAPGR